MSKEREISFGGSGKCAVELEAEAVNPASDPELTVSRYAVHGLRAGSLAILVTRSGVAAIVKVEVADRGTNLQSDELEQIRKAAEGIFRTQTG
jgi:hypothetical protein